jgi:hypothetical protein
MGWQSYFIGYNTDAELTHILQVIAQHNLAHLVSEEIAKQCPEIQESGEVGGELVMICKCEIKTPYVSGELKDFTKAVLCANGEARWTTYKYFKEHGLTFAGFETRHRKRLNEEKEWEYLPKAGFKRMMEEYVEKRDKEKKEEKCDDCGKPVEGNDLETNQETGVDYRGEGSSNNYY